MSGAGQKAVDCMQLGLSGGQTGGRLREVTMDREGRQRGRGLTVEEEEPARKTEEERPGREEELGPCLQEEGLGISVKCC